jgi:hypothetical protein
MTKLEKKALEALRLWLKAGIYRQSTTQEGVLLNCAVALEAQATGKTEREVMDEVLAVPSPLERHQADTKLRDRLRTALRDMGAGDRGPEFRLVAEQLIVRAVFADLGKSLSMRRQGSDELHFDLTFCEQASFAQLAAVLVHETEHYIVERNNRRGARA